MSEREIKSCPKCGGDMEIGYLPGAFSWSAGKSLWSIKSLREFLRIDARIVVTSNSIQRKKGISHE